MLCLKTLEWSQKNYKRKIIVCVAKTTNSTGRYLKNRRNLKTPKWTAWVRRKRIRSRATWWTRRAPSTTSCSSISSGRRWRCERRSSAARAARRPCLTAAPRSCRWSRSATAVDARSRSYRRSNTTDEQQQQPLCFLRIFVYYFCDWPKSMSLIFQL